MTHELINLCFTLAVVLTGFCLADAILAALCHDAKPAKDNHDH